MAMGKGSLGGGSIFRGFTNYPRCQLFSCPHLRGVSYKCCAYCDKREKCDDKCLNTPDRCKMCIYPEGCEEMPYTLESNDIPDHPDIRKMEMYGTLHPEETEEEPVCPICGKECETIYIDIDNDVCGCDQCVNKKDAWDWKEEKERLQ